MGLSGHREELFALCSGYVLGALDEPEQRTLEQHLAEGCPDCEAELRSLANSAVLLATSAPQFAAPPALKAKLFDRIRTEGAVRAPVSAPAMPGRKIVALPHRRRSSPLVWAFAAAAAVLAVTSALMWSATERLRGDLVAARLQIDTQRQQLSNKQQELAEAQRWTDLVEGAGTRLVDLAITPAGSAILKARALYDPQAHRAMIVFSNFTPPAGADYQLWALRDGKPSSLGVIHADASGRAIVRLPDTGDPASLGAFAVSLERAGGASTPTAPEGPVVMVGMLAGS